MMVGAAARAANVSLPLRFAPSLLNSPTTSQTCKWIQNGENTEQVKGNRGDEVVPDSEEERLMEIEGLDIINAQPQVEVIEIFSSDEDIEQGRKSDFENDPFLESIPGSWPANNGAKQDSSDRAKRPPKPKVPGQTKNSFRKVQTPRSRRIVQSSSSGGLDSDSSHTHQQPDVIELIDGSPEKPPSKDIKGKQVMPPRPALKKPSRSAPEHVVSLYADDDDDDGLCNADDGSILTLNDPGTAHKPIRRSPSFPNAKTTALKHRSIPITHSKSLGADFVDLVSDDDFVVLPPTVTPSSRTRRTAGGTPSTSSLPRKAPRVTKKAHAAAEQARREKYAADLFEELNRAVFEDGLPKETKMNWNKRLLTTAGRAKWHRSRDGVHTTEIELATKILDSDERIRNTLSHEMCHLACWIINGDPKEGHGKVWKGWAAKVERKRTDIEVTTKHNYEISYPYEWECERCAKVYGRFSKSIRPDECVCGACKVGKLVPLFAQPAPKTPKTKAGSRMAQEKTQGSPCSIAPPLLGYGEETVISHRTPGLGQKVYSVDPSDSDSDLEILTMSLSGVKISAGHL